MRYMTKVLVDTNILIYSVDELEGEKHLKAAETVQRLMESGEMIISSQNLAELSRVLLEKANPPQKHDDVTKYLFRFHKLGRVVDYNSETVIRAVMLSKEYKIHFFDALLVATMQENNVSEILTENIGDFKKISWLKARNPFKKWDVMSSKKKKKPKEIEEKLKFKTDDPKLSEKIDEIVYDQE